MSRYCGTSHSYNATYTCPSTNWRTAYGTRTACDRFDGTLNNSQNIAAKTAIGKTRLLRSKAIGGLCCLLIWWKVGFSYAVHDPYDESSDITPKIPVCMA